MKALLISLLMLTSMSHTSNCKNGIHKKHLNGDPSKTRLLRECKMHTVKEGEFTSYYSRENNKQVTRRYMKGNGRIYAGGTYFITQFPNLDKYERQVTFISDEANSVLVSTGLFVDSIVTKYDSSGNLSQEFGFYKQTAIMVVDYHEKTSTAYKTSIISQNTKLYPLSYASFIFDGSGGLIRLHNYSKCQVYDYKNSPRNLRAEQFSLGDLFIGKGNGGIRVYRETMYVGKCAIKF